MKKNKKATSTNIPKKNVSEEARNKNANKENKPSTKRSATGANAKKNKNRPVTPEPQSNTKQQIPPSRDDSKNTLFEEQSFYG